ncbi:fibrinogen-like protein 1 [Cololabis saira]|uniref:fibrinogen-like protein 1 n=1 Tax=Cololabis saira TaxID=129043 RepID=UPI002AD20B16|nr:fibrinogen-like protein 1 [Cololabis saira]
MRESVVPLIIGLTVIAACTKCLCMSDGCHDEVARLRGLEKLLQSQLQKQELLLHRLQLRTQPGNMNPALVDQIQDTQHTDCSQLSRSGSNSSGLYQIRPGSSNSGVTVFCDLAGGGGWTVIQRRLNGAVTFNRSWAEYKDGFGDMNAEFWLGNDNLHHITTQGNYSLRINLEDFDGNQRYAEYKDFKVANEKEHYRLTFGEYTGTAGDAFAGNHRTEISEWASHQSMRFSTYDQDNDNYRGNCAQEDKGGWWFNKCHSAHLNGVYYPKGYYSAATDDGIVWYTWRGWWYSLKTSIMKIRPIDFKTQSTDDPNKVPHAPPS